MNRLDLRRLRFARIEPAKLWGWFSRATDEDLRKATTEDKRKLLEVLRKLRGRDRIGVAADLALIALGMATGWGVAGAVAGALGLSSLLTVFGVTLVLAATPVGVVIGSILMFGALAFLLSRLVRSGARNDATRRRVEQEIRAELRKHDAPSPDDPDFLRFAKEIENAVEDDLLHPGIAAKTITAVLSGVMGFEAAREGVRKAVASRRAAKASAAA